MTTTETEDRRYIDVPISKGKGTVRMYVEDIPEAMWIEAATRGLKDMLTTGLTKVTVKGLEGEELEKAQAEAMKIAHANAEKVLAGSFKISGRASSSKTPGKVMTEARRLAKAQVKAEIKLAGFKISHIPAKHITELANEYLASEDGAALIEQAQKNIEAIETAASKKKLDPSKVHVDPKMVAADAKRTAERQAKAAAEGKKGKSRPEATA